MRVFGYSRVSTSEQVDDGASLDVQQQQIMGYCLIKGYALAEHFVERGVRLRAACRSARMQAAPGDDRQGRRRHLR